MPQLTTAGLIEARSIDWVPDDERTGKLWHQGPLWFLGNFQYFSIPIGFIGPSLGLSLGWTIVAGALGILVGTLFMAFHASQGPTMGLPQMIQSRAQFGYRGVVVPLIATLFTYLAFNVVDAVLLGDGLNSAFGWNRTAVMVLATVAAAALAIFGHDWLHRAFRVLLVVSLPLMTVVTVGILLGAAGGGPAPATVTSGGGGFTWAAFLAQFSAGAAYNITYAPYVSDYSRYLPSNTPARKVIAAVFFGASGAAIWLIALGAWLATRLGATDGLAGLQQAGNTVVPYLGDAAALLSALALWATMGMNAYGGMLTVLTGVDAFRPLQPRRMHRVVTILVLAVVWFVISLAITGDAVSAVATGLTLMLYLLVPWTAANLVDFFVVRRGHYAITDLFSPDGIYGVWQWRGLAAYGIGLLAEVPFMVLPGVYTGPFAAALGGIDVAWLVGLAVTAVAYLLFSRSLDRSAEHAAEASSEARLRAHRVMKGPVDATKVPRFAGPATFARLPRLDEVERADVAVLGVPFDSGVSYRPGARFGPGHVRASSKLLRPFHPALSVSPFAVQQVADAGDVAVNPFDLTEAITTVERASDALRGSGTTLLTIGGDHTIALPLLRSVARDHGRVAVLHFDAHLDTWDTYFGAPYTHGTPFRRAAEEGLLDPERCLHVGIRGPLYGADDLRDDRSLGFSVIGSDDYQTEGLRGVVERMRERLGDGPVYVSVDIDVLDPAHAPGTGTPEAGGLTSRELLHTLRSLVGVDVVGADIVEVAPAYDHAEITGIAAAHVAYELLAVLAAGRA